MRCAVLLLAGLLVSQNQNSTGPAIVNMGGGGHGYGGYGGFGWGGFGGGGTVEGNFLMGASQVIRSEGEYNYYNSLAGINYEETRGRYIDNYKKWQQIQAQIREERDRIAAQTIESNRQRNEALNMQRASAPPPQHGLGQNSFDRITGKITWPETLMTTAYEEHRKEIDKQFELRAKTGGTPAGANVVRAEVSKMLSLLRKDIEKIPSGQYVAARKFLNAVDYTARNETAREVDQVEVLPPSAGIPNG
ncbi:MAG: hypothetical protein JSS02_26425 [Planctomycetes bacterium]|nr:hypothetical protein [Planctomycetota bacterium]